MYWYQDYLGGFREESRCLRSRKGTLLSIKEIGRGKVLKPGKVRRDLLHHWALGSQDLCFCQSVEYLLWREPNRSFGSVLHDLDKEKRVSCPKLHSHLVARHWRTLYAGSVVCSSSCWWWKYLSKGISEQFSGGGWEDPMELGIQETT